MPSIRKKSWGIKTKRVRLPVLVVAIFLIVTFLSVRAFYINPLTERSCKNLNQNISDFKTQARYCTQDSECTALQQEVRPCECYTVVNRNTNFDEIKEDVAAYNARCTEQNRACETCNPFPQKENIVCRNNLCTEIAGIIMRTDSYIYSSSEQVNVTLINEGKSDIWIKNYCPTALLLVPVKHNETDVFNMVVPNKNQKTECSVIAATQVALGDRINLSTSLDTYGAIEPGQYKFMIYYAIVDFTKVGQKVKFFEAFSNEFMINQ